MKRTIILTLAISMIFTLMHDNIIPDATALGRNVSENDRSNGSIEMWNKSEYPISNFLSEGGNISEVNMSLKWQSKNWQGFHGVINQTGVVLEDLNGRSFFNWSTGNVSGQIFFTPYTIENWYYISNASLQNVIHAQYNLSYANTTDLDSLRRTYNTTKYHEGFNIVVDDLTIPIQGAPANNIYTNNTNLSAINTRYSTFNSSMIWYNGTGTNGDGLALDQSMGAPVYTALIQYNGSSYKNNASMYDDATGWKRADYSVLVPINTSKSSMSDIYYVYGQIGDETVIN